MENMKNLIEFHVIFATDYSQLMKMVSDPEKLYAFKTYLEDIHILKKRFSYLEISRTQKTRMDSLVRIAMNQSSYIVYMDTKYHSPKSLIDMLQLYLSGCKSSM
ncbi:unnamed protein product [Brassica rapa]|uniref:Uncharacterized protein n=1 Tax=Brassica campestris TaxID=3711 RepID=A0A3P6AGZ4_BRACM|nr:unnamed protein product [Brassica rapa]VDC86704.1 unnamed protein product [Brassica rapa]